MLENIKLIATDLDGTLLTAKKDISEKTRNTIEQCLNRGAVFVPCTGRAFEAIHPWLRNHEKIRYYISTNGAVVYDKKAERILNCYDIDFDTVKKISESLSRDTSLEIIIDGKLYTGKKIDIYIYGVQDYFQYHYYQTRIEVGDLLEFARRAEKPIEKVHIIFKDPEEREKILREFSVFEDLCVCPAPGKCIEITDKRATKGDAVKFLCDTLKISCDDVLYFGDQANDMSALKYCRHVVAMENAVAELKESAFVVTETNDNDGVARIIDQWTESHKDC